MIPGFTWSQTAKSQSLERIAILQEMGTTVATSGHGGAQNWAQWKFSGDKHKSLQVDTERTFHQRCPLVML